MSDVRSRAMGIAWRVATLAALVAVTAAAQAPSGGAGTGGLGRLATERRFAGNWRRVLMIGAHPDDEDTELLTILARGQGVQAAYLSLTRGDGGQNLIGAELGEMLGVLRSEELAAARRIDGGLQFFTRAFDFGFSKTEEETLRFWDRDSVLKDMVRVIRRFRPQVIVSVWSGTPADGHGHHQASGTLALEAFRAAGDPARYSELLGQEGLAPWRPLKFYRTAGRGSAGTATLTFDGGIIDPSLGLSLHQIAARSRSQHRSQNQGNLEALGPSHVGLRLVERAAGLTGTDDSLFAGVPPEPAPVPDVHAAEARLIESGIVLDATTDDDEVTPGEGLTVTVDAWNSGRDTLRARFAMVPHAGYAVRGGDCATTGLVIAPGTLYTCRISAAVESHARPTTPYYLALPRDRAMYRWSGDPSDWGEPFERPLEAQFELALGTTPPVTVRREIEARFRDPVLGEVRRPVMIVPSIAVSLEPGDVLWPLGTRARVFRVALEHLTRDTTDASVALDVPAKWSVTPAQRVHLSREGERAIATFTVTAPIDVQPGPERIAARVVAAGDTLSTGLYRIRYPHVRPRNVSTDAVARVLVAGVKFPPVTAIGYVRGGGDRVPEAMMDAGLPITLLSGDALERGPLDRFKVIVIGPRAYEADESLMLAHPRLMRWLEAGGTLIVQYQQRPYVLGGFAPRPLTLVAPTQSRVTDETAPVTMLGAHRVLQWPNAISAADFDNWVQERGLDFPTEWDRAWTPILEMHDPGDTPRQGGLLIATVGRGTAVYTGLAFHRQLPAMIPGAWRLWANLLALGQRPATATGARR